MTNPKSPNYIIELLDTSKHNRADFTCGVQQVDNFFKNTANKLSKADNLRVYVMSQENGDVIGFYTINAHAIEYSDLPDKFARNRPSHDNIPSVYISMIGRDIKYAKGGFGGDLLVDCLKRILNASEQVGIAVVILDVLGCGNPELASKRLKLYKSYGFWELPSHPLRLFISIATIRKIFDEKLSTMPSYLSRCNLFLR